jgi:1-deoxy-D-xylulose-5-phosphate synthase
MSQLLLDTIQKPEDVQKLSINDLSRLAEEIRSFLIESVSHTGGHIGANLGVVELTIALHYVLGSREQILFDTGHQGYTHKLLTGRKNLFASLNQPGGMSRFLDRRESSYDTIDASHAGTAISIAAGLAQTHKLNGDDHCTVAFVGDGALVEGMSLEGLNFGTASDIPLMIVINDNGMAIPPNVGGISNLFSGADSLEKSKHFFEGLGYQYFGVEDGHDTAALVQAITDAREQVKNGAVIVHAKTEKGRGLALAKNHPYKLHFSMPFDPESGAGISPTPAGTTYGAVAGVKMHELMAKDEDMVILTPSTPYASFLDACFTDFPERTIDVGMAEQHAMGMACGLALSGKKPFACFQSTFMQRAFDQLIHDAAFMNLPVTVMAVRSGFAGLDSSTHHGIYDFSYLKAIPNLEIFYPASTRDLEEMIAYRTKHAEHPMVILYPYEAVSTHDAFIAEGFKNLDLPQEVHEGDDGLILFPGNCVDTAVELQALLAKSGYKYATAAIRHIRPLAEDWLVEKIQQYSRIVVLEENVLDGGLGSDIASIVVDHGLSSQVLRAGIPTTFASTGSKQELQVETGIDAQSILQKMQERWGI